MDNVLLGIRLITGAGVGFEAVMNGIEVGMELSQGGDKLGVVRAGEELGRQGEEEGNLESDLVGIGTVEDAIKLGVEERSIEFFGEGGFGFEGLRLGLEIFFVVIFAADVGFELVGGMGKNSG